jgi:hypothetical protein
MERRRAKRIACLAVTGSLVVVATGTAYRALLARWRGDAREPLIAATLVGMTYFIFVLVGLRLVERREELQRRDQRD